MSTYGRIGDRTKEARVSTLAKSLIVTAGVLVVGAAIVAYIRGVQFVKAL